MKMDLQLKMLREHMLNHIKRMWHQHQRIHIYIIVVITVLSIVGCTGCSETKDGTAGDASQAGFEQTMSVADSLYNGMQFRDAYDLYVQLLDSKEAEADSEKKLRVLNSLSNASELSGHKDMENKWLQQQMDLAEATGNDYYHAMAYVEMGQNIFFEGDREKGIEYVNEAISLMAKTDCNSADHLTHGFLNLLASLRFTAAEADSASILWDLYRRLHFLEIFSVELEDEFLESQFAAAKGFTDFYTRTMEAKLWYLRLKFDPERSYEIEGIYEMYSRDHAIVAFYVKKM